MTPRKSLFNTKDLSRVLATGLLISGAYSWAGEETVIELGAIPQEVLEKANKLLPHAKFHSANTESEDDGSLIYEIQGTLKDGRKVEVDLYEDGRIEEFEVEYSRDLVPGAVLKAIERKLPGFQADFIEASYSASKKVIQYEFVGKFEGQKLDLDVSADGRHIEIADQ